MEVLKQIIKIEKLKICKKGFFNTLIAWILFFGILWVGHRLGEWYWPQQIQNKEVFVILCSFLIHFGVQFLVFLAFLPGYLKKSDYLEKHLIDKAVPKAWQRSDWQQILRKTLINLLINEVGVYSLIVLASMKTFGVKYRFDNFPAFTEVVIQVICLSFIDDFATFWIHRAFHHYPFLYQFHKVHHQFKTPFVLVNEYAHPFEFVFLNLLTFFIGPTLLSSKLHIFTFFLWAFWKLVSSTEGHSGYEVPFMPNRIFFFTSGPSYHDFHHSKNVGNYGNFYLWDLIFGTNGDYLKQFFKEDGSHGHDAKNKIQ